MSNSTKRSNEKRSELKRRASIQSNQFHSKYDRHRMMTKKMSKEKHPWRNVGNQRRNIRRRNRLEQKKVNECLMGLSIHRLWFELDFAISHNLNLLLFFFRMHKT